MSINKYMYYTFPHMQSGGSEHKSKSQALNEDDITITISQPWFDLIKSGDKKAEGRLKKSTFAKLKINDVVIWTYNDLKCRTKIVSINEYKTFADMLEHEGLNNVLPVNKIPKGVKYKIPVNKVPKGVKYDKNGIPIVNNVEDGVNNVYRVHYPKEEDEKKFGVLAIVVEVI